MTIRRPASPFRTLLIVCIIVLGIGGLFYFLTSQYSTTVSTNVNAQSPASNETQATAEAEIEEEETTYEDEEFHFSIRYPSTWDETKNESGTGETRIVNYVFGDGSDGVTLIVVPDALEGIVRESVSITKEEAVAVNGLAATRAEGRTAKDGSRIDLLLITKDGMVFVLNGTPDLVDRIGGTFVFST